MLNDSTQGPKAKEAVQLSKEIEIQIRAVADRMAPLLKALEDY